MMKSLMYLIAILASFFFLLVGGVVAGSLLFYLTGNFVSSLIDASYYEYNQSRSGLFVLTGSITGGLAGLCWWFKTVGYIVELENVSLTKNVSLVEPSSFADAHLSPPKEAEPFICERDAKLGNHMMIGGTVIFLSSVIYFSQLSFILGCGGLALMLAGFLASLAAYEYPSEAGMWRKIKLLLKNTRT